MFGTQKWGRLDGTGWEWDNYNPAGGPAPAICPIP